jgi:DNA-binding CsgD family transcriptional regulator
MADQFAKKKTIINKLKIIPWTQFSTSPVRLAQSEKFGIGIGISLIFAKNGFTDFFHFGTRNENHQMIGFYTIYSDCLIQFAYYFYDAANKIITEGAKPNNRLFISDRAYHKDNDFPKIENLDIQNFMKSTQPKKFIVHSSHEQVTLTKKEIQCIAYLTQGKTASEIGNILCMSKRTVETHLKNSRLKFGLEAGAGKSELIAELYKRKFDLNDLHFEKNRACSL